MLIFPFKIDGQGILSDQLILARFRLQWAFGLISIKGDTQRGIYLYLFWIKTFRLKDDEGDVKQKEKKIEKKKYKKSQEKRPAPFLMWVNWFRSNYKTILIILKHCLAAFHLRGGIYGTVGLGDPADMAILDFVRRYLTCSDCNFQVEVWPDYIDENIDLTFNGSAWFVFLQFLFLPIYWLIRGDTRRMIFCIPKAQKIE
jgi:hypothetical protein